VAQARSIDMIHHVRAASHESDVPRWGSISCTAFTAAHAGDTLLEL
jgi:hypothetical protein